MNILFRPFLALSVLLWTLPATAHTGLELPTTAGFAGFISGVLHPLHGLDHLLVMLAVGVWAARLGGNALWSLPCGFLIMMATGAGLHALGGSIIGAENWVALSLLGLGLLLSYRHTVSILPATALICAFALSHGYLHAAEAERSLGAYAIGFLLSTALLHGFGLGIGLLSGRMAKGLRTAFALLCTVTSAALLAGVGI